MKKIFSILLSLALLVSLGALTTAPVAAATLPSINPTSATYNLDLPTQLVVSVDYGSPAGTLGNITNTGNGTALVGGTDYIVFETIIVFSSTYLRGALTKVGQTLTLQFNFNMPGPYVYSVYLAITSSGTAPALVPNTANYSLAAPASVTVAVMLGIATDVSSVGDDVGDIGSGNWSHNATASTLTILNTYLAGKFPGGAANTTNIGKSVVLNVAFNRGSNATLTVTVTGVALPSISPLIVYWDYLKSPQVNATASITWGPMTPGVIWVVYDKTYISTAADIGAGNWSISADNKTLIISTTWLNTVFNDYMQGLGYIYRLLQVQFGSALVWAPLVIVAGPSSPSIAPTTDTWNMDTGVGSSGAPYDYTVPAFYPTSAATAVMNITDQDGYNMTVWSGPSGPVGGACNKSFNQNYDWGVAFNPTLNTFVLSVRACYFQGSNRTYANGTVIGKPVLQKPGDKATLKVSFDKGMPVTWTITATGTGAAISAATADFNLDTPTDLSSTITWNKWARNVTSITDSGTPVYTLVRGVDFTLTPNGSSATLGSVGGTSALVINQSYLSDVLAKIGDSIVLTIAVDSGNALKLTVTATGTASCFIATAAGASAPELTILRAFRDSVLRQNVLGRAFIRAYYTVSPSIAKVVATSSVLKTLVMKFIVNPAVFIAQKVMG